MAGHPSRPVKEPLRQRLGLEGLIQEYLERPRDEQAKADIVALGVLREPLHDRAAPDVGLVPQLPRIVFASIDIGRGALQVFHRLLDNIRREHALEGFGEESVTFPATKDLRGSGFQPFPSVQEGLLDLPSDGHQGRGGGEAQALLLVIVAIQRTSPHDTVMRDLLLPPRSRSVPR